MRKILAISLFVCFFLTTLVIANSVTETIGSKKRTAKIVFDGYNIASDSYVYNEAGSTDPDDGSIILDSFFGGKKVVQIKIEKGGVNNFDIIILIKAHPNVTSWGEVIILNFTVATTANQDYIQVVNEPAFEIAFGVKHDNTGAVDPGDKLTLTFLVEGEIGVR